MGDRQQNKDSAKNGMLKNWIGFVDLTQALFTLPFALTAMVLAARASFKNLPEAEQILSPHLERGWPGWRVLVLIVAAVVAARACVVGFHRIIERNHDRAHKVRRRGPLPSGHISLFGAWTITLIAGVVFMAVCWVINPTCFYLAPVALGLGLLYTVSIRFTHFSRFVLGLALAVIPLGTWLAVTGGLEFTPPRAGLRQGLIVPLLMSLMILCWTVGFCLVQSIGDYEFDRERGRRSLVVFMGPVNALQASLLAHMLMAGCMTVLGLLCGFRMPFWIGLMIILCTLGLEHWIARKRSLDWAEKAFRNLNNIISMVFLAVVIAEVGFPNFWKFRGW